MEVIARCLGLALPVLIAGCVDLSRPPAARPVDVDARAAPDGARDATQPDRPASDGGAPDLSPTPDTTAAPDVAGAPDIALDQASPAPDAAACTVGCACVAHADCKNSMFCDGGRCVAKQTAGAGCVVPIQCDSGVCSDGVCCRSSCTAPCHACNVAGALGTCTAVAAGQDPRSECPAEDASTCRRAGGCNGAGACRLHASGTVCGAGSCSALIETAPARCNGAGSCLAGSTRDCGNYQCAGASCATTCTSATGCRNGYVCFGDQCVLPGNLPLLYWKLDETSGLYAVDASGNGYNGAYVGVSGTPVPSTSVPTLTFANPRSRAFIMANRQAVQLGVMPAALRPSNNLTVAAWYRATAVDPESPFQASDVVSGGDQYVLRVRTTGIQFTKRLATEYARLDGTVSGHLDGRWHHIAGVTSPAGMRVYYDGVERGVNDVGDPISYDKGQGLWVGRHGNTQEEWDFDGNIDDVRIYGRALSAAEIAALAQGRN